jgi:ribosomal protein S18 acetylase RimI-like enzyme
MLECRFVEKIPTPEHYNELRQSVGWGIYETSVIERALSQSLYCVCAFAGETIVAMARIIGDGGLVYYIQDVIVKPEYQRRGIGNKLMDAVMAYVCAHASNNSIVGLMSAKDKEPFYEKYGFVSRPTDRLGCGMTQFWKKGQVI